MSIERDAQIRFAEMGTLNAVTRWISSHDEGIAEWLKNARRAYQSDRADVKEEHRVAVLLLKDGSERDRARIGLLDVGGATIEDVTAWSTWQDTEASRRGTDVMEEETQGNGGKAYMFRLFRGPSRIMGVRDSKRNCKGFEGEEWDVSRGTPGFMPDAANGRELTITSVKVEIQRAIGPYGIDFADLPSPVQRAIEDRSAFTLVEGTAPTSLFKNQIPCEDLVTRTLRHEQSTLAIQQLRLYAIHQGRVLNDGKPFDLPTIEPFPGLEGPLVFPIPEKLPLPEGGEISTTEGGQQPAGRLILQTSKENMPRVYKNLRPRWRISYKASALDMIGSMPVSDFTPTTPGSHYIYGSVELPALAPAYVEHGRRRPKPGPLVDAVGAFIAEKIREVARGINEQKKRALDDDALDQVQLENQKLDEFKNKFLTLDSGEGGQGADGSEGRRRWTRDDVEYGKVAETIELAIPSGPLKVGCGVEVHVRQLLQVRVLDALRRPVRTAVQWTSDNPSVARFDKAGDLLFARNKGRANIWGSIRAGRNQTIESHPRIELEVLMVDHVLLTPRKLEIALGSRASILAEVTDEDGNRSTDVLLKWRHNADDPLTVLIGPKGTVTGNRLGKTSVMAGAIGADGSEVWSRIPVEVEVVRSPEKGQRGGGFPRLLLTDRDIDPATGQIREGDPDSPALWQEASDYVHNVWWVNLQSPEARFAFGQRSENPVLWRNFHAGIVMEMVIQVHMQAEYTRKANQQPDLWANHKQILDVQRVISVQEMWERLEAYVQEATDLA